MKTLDKIIKTAVTSIASSLLFLNPTKAANIESIKVMTPIEQSIGTTNYYTSNITNADSSIETRLYKDDHHFMSIIEKNGCAAMRFAPGMDIDRWGSTFYPHPFLPGATLKGLTSKIISPWGSDRIQVRLEGTVSRGTSQTFGVYILDMYFQCTAKNYVYGNGIMAIALSAPLSTVNGDLNLFKIASNYLDEVPKLDGTTGDTGDTKIIQVRGWTSNNTSVYKDFTWDPVSQPGFFPWEFYKRLSINLPAEYNNVDTVKQGYAPIKAAFKPSLGVMILGFNNQTFIFGGMYNTSQSKQFWSDNIGVTPLVIKSDPATNIMFNVYINSYPHDADALQNEITLNATGNQNSCAGVYYTPDLKFPFLRVGTLPYSNGKYSGTIKLSPEIRGLSGQNKTGFLKVLEE